MADYAPIRNKFVCTGVDLKHPVDAMPAGKYPYLENVMALGDDFVQTRDGLGNLTFGHQLDQLFGHSLKRMNSNLPGAAHSFLRFAGYGTKLYVDTNTGTYTPIDTGYSGNPLSFVPFRPTQSPEPWLYIGDSNKLRKASMDGATVYDMGVQPPVEAPITDIAPPNNAPVTKFDATPTWTATGNAGSVTTGNARVPAATTIAAILYDLSNTGWACVQPSSTNNNWLGEGALLTLASEDCWIDQTFEVQPATTVAGILYDSGSTGLCSISAATPYASMKRNQLIFVGGHATRVLSVTVGPDGQYSFRCSLPATVAVGAAITFVPSFRAYTTTTHAAGDAITGTTATVTFSGAGAGAIHGADVLNLQVINGRQVQVEDYLHLSVRFDHPENVQEVRLWLDIDTNGNNDFLHNSLMYAFRPDDTQAVMAGSLTALTGAQTALQNYQIDAAGDQVLSSSVSGQMALGMQAWTELFINIAELQRNGTDPASSLATVKALQLSAITLDTCVMEVSAWWIGGTFGPDINQKVNGPSEGEILYRYKYRSSATGAESLPSPMSRSGVFPKRGQVIFNCLASSDPQIDKIDIERMGGSLTQFHYVGTMENSSPRTTDSLWDVAAEVLPPLNTTTVRPFPVTDQPRRGVVNTAGTSVSRVSGDLFNLNWQAGTQIKINGIAYTLYSTPRSTGFLEVVENIGPLTNATLEIPAATILGFPLPIIFGNSITVFGVGDPYNPGRCYFCNGNDPDSCAGTNYIEVTSPSEPLVSGCCDVDGNAYVFSSLRPYALTPTPDAANGWTATPIASPSGLFSPWALSSGKTISFLGADGLYDMPVGGTPALITYDDIDPVFPHNGLLPAAAVGQGIQWPTPDFTATSKLRLACGLSWLWFTYPDQAGVFHTLAFDLNKRGWFPWTFKPNAGGVTFQYQEEGEGLNSILIAGDKGFIYAPFPSGTQDAGTPIAGTIQLPVRDGGNARTEKEWGDLWIDYSSDAGIGQLNVLPSYDNYTTDGVSKNLPANSQSFSTPVRGQQIVELHSDFDTTVFRNFGGTITWVSTAGWKGVFLYEWTPTYIEQGEFSFRRFTDWSDGGYPGNKFLQGIRIKGGWDLTSDLLGPPEILIQSDSGVEAAVTPTTTPIFGVFVASLEAALFGHLFRVLPSFETESAPQDQWRVLSVEYIFEPMPDGVPSWISQWTSHGAKGYQHIRDSQIAYFATATVELDVVKDNGAIDSYTLPATLPASLQWQPNTAYSMGQTVVDPAGHKQQVAIAGTSGATQPTWQDSGGNTIDNTVTWIDLGRATDVSPLVLKKNYLEFVATSKSKLYQYQFFTGGLLYLFRDYCEVRYKEWGSQGDYEIAKPFGDQSLAFGGARI